MPAATPIPTSDAITLAGRSGRRSGGSHDRSFADDPRHQPDAGHAEERAPDPAATHTGTVSVRAAS
jgi:hypothetical protein